MNPTIIVQQNYDFSDLQLPVNQPPVQPATNKSRAAIIRSIEPTEEQAKLHPTEKPQIQPIGSENLVETVKTATRSGQYSSDRPPSAAPTSIPVEIRPVSLPTPSNEASQQSDANFESHLRKRLTTTALPEDQALDLLAKLNSNQYLPLQTPEIPSAQSSRSSVAPNFEELSQGVGAAPRVTLPPTAQPDHSASGSGSQGEAEKVTQEFPFGSKGEITSKMAAWDVEDFRWSETTNQLIVSGGNSLNQLHQSLLDLISPQQSRIIIGGVERGVGTTSIAIGLARWIAGLRKKVLLVDGDLSKAGLSRQAGMAKDISWMNTICHPLPDAELTVRSKESNVCLMPLASVESRSQWPRFIYDELGKIIDRARHDFDLIITDIGPAEQMMAELSRPSCIADATVLVHDGVQSSLLETAQNRMKMFGLTNLIIAQNRATLPTQNAAQTNCITGCMRT